MDVWSSQQCSDKSNRSWSGINAAQNIQSKILSWLLEDIYAACSFNPQGAIFKQAVINAEKLHDMCRYRLSFDYSDFSLWVSL